jgi:hypothetical protein
VKVRELLTVLAHVDPDAEVTITGPRGSYHVEHVTVPLRRVASGCEEHTEAYLRSRVRFTGWDCRWYEEAPPFELEGRFRRKAELLETLSAMWLDELAQPPTNPADDLPARSVPERLLSLTDRLGGVEQKLRDAIEAAERSKASRQEPDDGHD